MSESVLQIERQDGVATLTLDRPQTMNALSRALRVALTKAFRELPEEADVDVLILTGRGDRAFSAGLDLKELGGETGEGDDATQAVIGGADVIEAMETCSIPIIGAINGFAITGGFELALACDLLIASPAARFADTHARVGIMPGWGLSQKLSRLIGLYRAKELSLTGNYLEAQQACEWGLVNRVVPAEELLATCHALAQDMRSCDPELMRAYKHVIDQGFATTYAEGRALETSANRERSGKTSAEDIATRRLAVQQRGRHQSGDR